MSGDGEALRRLLGDAQAVAHVLRTATPDGKPRTVGELSDATSIGVGRLFDVLVGLEEAGQADEPMPGYWVVR